MKLWRWRPGGGRGAGGCSGRAARRLAAAAGTALVTSSAVVSGATQRQAYVLPPGCSDSFVLPSPPLRATDLNGAALQDVCFTMPGEHHVFVLGDWGGVQTEGGTVVPADRREKKFGAGHYRDFVEGVDDFAQQRVAQQMALRAKTSPPDYVLNVGDNFYWGGIDEHCGASPNQHIKMPGQWGPIFENIYVGEGIDQKPWLSVLGNHDYGGYTFLQAWDQQIGYSWGGAGNTGRWVMPAQYWKVKVWYPDHSVDFYFIDTNVFDTGHPLDDAGHNICSLQHNPTPASCGPQGPESVWDCPRWFGRLWDQQMEWVEAHLAASTADWHVVVTHFPPTWGHEDWQPLAAKYGIDLIVSGHVHSQHVFGPEDPANVVRPTAVVISGGGGGITSEGQPDPNGNDDEYGFMDLTFTRERIIIEAVSHGGIVRSRTAVNPRLPLHNSTWRYQHHSLAGSLESEQGLTEAEKRRADPKRIPRCDGTSCPQEWLGGVPGIGGYYCPPGPGLVSGDGCRMGELGPWVPGMCPGQCFIGDPPVKSFSTTTTTLSTTTTTTSTSRIAACETLATMCPQAWALGNSDGGYFCRSTHGCRPRAQGPFQPDECEEQCLIVSTPSPTLNSAASRGGEKRPLLSEGRAQPHGSSVARGGEEDERWRKATQLLRAFQSEYKEGGQRSAAPDSVPGSEAATGMQHDWETVRFQ